MFAARLLLICATSMLLAGSLQPNTASADTLLGKWVLNQELSRALQPANTNTKKSIFGGFGGSSNVVIGGIPIPMPGSSRAKEVSGAPVKDPQVLRCAEMTIELVGKDILLTYIGFGSEQLKQGNVRGTKTTYQPNKLTSRYETTTRKVTKTYQLTKEGRLHAIVKLNPKKGKTLVYHRVFDRAG